MHELTVAIRIREVLQTELAAEDDLVVESVRVQVGALTNIVPEALQFAWPHAVADSALLGGSSIDIDWVDAQLRCRSCSATHTSATLVTLRCPACRSGEVDIVGGDELDILDVQVRDVVAG